MDADFAMLLEYLTRKKQPTLVSSEPLEKKKCLHEGTDTDEEHVCQKTFDETTFNVVSYSVRSIALTCTG